MKVRFDLGGRATRQPLPPPPHWHCAQTRLTTPPPPSLTSPSHARAQLAVTLEASPGCTVPSFAGTATIKLDRQPPNSVNVTSLTVWCGDGDARCKFMLCKEPKDSRQFCVSQYRGGDLALVNIVARGKLNASFAMEVRRPDAQALAGTGAEWDHMLAWLEARAAEWSKRSSPGAASVAPSPPPPAASPAAAAVTLRSADFGLVGRHPQYAPAPSRSSLTPSAASSGASNRAMLLGRNSIAGAGSFPAITSGSTAGGGHYSSAAAAGGAIVPKTSTSTPGGYGGLTKLVSNAPVARERCACVHLLL